MTRVAILWHMHQPFYEDLVTREHILPWVRLHALKDYYGMVALLREFPGVRATFNLVPSLLVQLEASPQTARATGTSSSGSSRRRARPTRDIALHPRELLSRAAAAHDRHLPALCGAACPAGHCCRRRRPARGRAAFSADDLRDLQVWHKLAWIDPFYLDGDPRVRALVAKGRDFSEDDKALLRAVELELLNTVIPEYRDARGAGQIELSTSPFYHPILPLLCDTDIYLRTHPDSRDAAAAVPASGRCGRTSSGGPWRVTSGCSAAGRSACGRRKGRCRTRWCRWCGRRASRGWRPTS